MEVELRTRASEVESERGRRAEGCMEEYTGDETRPDEMR